MQIGVRHFDRRQTLGLLQGEPGHSPGRRRRGTQGRLPAPISSATLATESICSAGRKALPYDGGPKVIYGRTKDFRNVDRDPRGYANWPMGDGLVSPWREGNRLYLFAGKQLHVMELPIEEEANRSK